MSSSRLSRRVQNTVRRPARLPRALNVDLPAQESRTLLLGQLTVLPGDLVDLQQGGYHLEGRQPSNFGCSLYAHFKAPSRDHSYGPFRARL